MLKYSKTGDRFSKSRLCLMCCANVLLLMGLCMILSAMFTSGWQTAYIEEDGSYYEHGLYRDCVKGQTNIQPVGDWICFWKYDQQNHIETDRFFKLRDYQIGVLTIFGISCGVAALTLVLACTTFCSRFCNIPWAVFALITAILAVIGLILFSYNAGISDNRFIRTENHETDMYLGSSFYVAIAGVLSHCIATVLAGVCVGLAFFERRRHNEEVTLNANDVYVVPSRTVSNASAVQAVIDQTNGGVQTKV